MPAASDTRSSRSGARRARPPGPPAGPAPRWRRGFTLIEVLIAMSLLLVGGVSILSVFTLAVVHRVERDVEAKVDLLRPEVKTIVQDTVDVAKKGQPPATLIDLPTSQAGYTLSCTFERSPNGEPAWVARPLLSYRGTVLRQGRFPPIWVSRSTFDPRR